MDLNRPNDRRCRPYSPAASMAQSAHKGLHRVKFCPVTAAIGSHLVAPRGEWLGSCVGLIGAGMEGKKSRDSVKQIKEN